MDLITVVLFVVGLVLLVLGADWLVKGSSRVAAAAGVSSLVIGLTVVAFGTSAPEMAVSVQAAWSGQADMAVGNVVGSNIFNVLGIIGLSALITPLIVAQQLVRRDVPIMIVLSLALLGLAWDGSINRLDGALLFAGLVAYTVWVIRVSRRESKAVEAEYEAEFGGEAARKAPILPSVGLVLAGLALLVLGSNWLVEGAVAFAKWMAIDEVVISLTIVAIGTSLPEVATSLTAALKGERDIAVGNVVGSNIFNIMGVLGVSGLVAPDGLRVIASMQGFDLPVMIAVAFACLPFFARGFTIPRWQGLLMVLYYVAYTAYLVLDAKQHAAKADYGRIMLQFVLPLTGLTLAVVAFRVLGSRKSTPA
ncbi:MAG: calcium/sodium antiporter [Planctomycetes bacterium]|jgi:cation:H+ antiporter|nr:calcium/sodium antiporter [Planctomycetota bacterium]